jgi:hypothetical protein
MKINKKEEKHNFISYGITTNALKLQQKLLIDVSEIRNENEWIMAIFNCSLSLLALGNSYFCLYGI